MRTEATLWLGTAMWGWGADERTAFGMLDQFVRLGGCIIDTAVNYPINKRAEDFGRANLIVATWLRSNPGVNVRVFCKIGALDNSGGANVSLHRSSVLTETEILRGKFLDHLWGVGIHWDNRTLPDEIADTLEAMGALRDDGLEIGFSGVQRPDLYAQAAPRLEPHWWIEVKENAATWAARERYEPFFPDARYIAYGINMGGVKEQGEIKPDSSLALRQLSEPPVVERLRGFLATASGLEPQPKSLNDLALMMAHAKQELSGVIIGPRSNEQLRETMGFWTRLSETPMDEQARAALAALAAG